VLLGFAAAWMVPGLIDSTEQRTLHRAAVHTDHSVLRTHVVRALPTPRTLVYRDRNGSLHRALVDETDLDRFANDTLDYLEAEPGKIKAETTTKIDALLATAFSDSQQSIARYADWYFGWGQSYFLLKEGIVGLERGRPAGLWAPAARSCSITHTTVSANVFLARSLNEPATKRSMPQRPNCPGRSGAISSKPSTFGSTIYARSSPSRS
jgi:hypothetical protein